MKILYNLVAHVYLLALYLYLLRKSNVRRKEEDRDNGLKGRAVSFGILLGIFYTLYQLIEDIQRVFF